jgi:hypothetical protein
MPSISRHSLRWLARGVVVLVVSVLFASAVATTLAYEPPEIQTGTVVSPTNGSTLVAVQGWHVDGRGNVNKPARLVSFGPNGTASWVYDGAKRGAAWFYDADPLPNGNVLAVNTIREDGVGKTLVYELDPETKERRWEVTFDITDTHDAELIGDDRLLVANMRQWDAENRTSNDRLFVYDLSEERIVWEWHFKNHYPSSTDGGMDPDWTHVNDVDEIAPGRYLVSPRNFDQVVVVDRETKRITLRLGADGDHDVLREQHNPAYLETDDGRPVILVADSENDRVVEYTCTERVGRTCQWNLTWELTGGLDWPRDANRLPNGNTLITDSRNHRVVEVTPTGRVVWEVYVPWGPFSAERVGVGNDGARSPTMHDLGHRGAYDITGSAELTPRTTSDTRTFPEWLRAHFGGLPVVGEPVRELADAWQAGAQWVRPVWMAPWSFVHLVVGSLVTLLWAVAEAGYQRHRLADRARAVVARVRDR